MIWDSCWASILPRFSYILLNNSYARTRCLWSLLSFLCIFGYYIEAFRGNVLLLHELYLFLWFDVKLSLIISYPCGRCIILVRAVQFLFQQCKSCSHLHDFHTSSYHNGKWAYGFWRSGVRYADVFPWSYPGLPNSA